MCHTKRVQQKAGGQALHSSWLLALMAAGIIGGAVAARYVVSPQELPIGWVVVAGLLCGICLWQQRMWCLPVALIGGWLCGYSRAVQVIVAEQPVQSFYQQTVRLHGVIRDDVSYRNGLDRLVVASLQLNGQAVAGKAWVSVAHQADLPLQRGDEVTLYGQLQPGFANFQATMYHAQMQSVVRTVHGDIALEVRQWFSRQVATIIPHPAVDLGLGFVVGEKTALPSDLLTALKTVGLTHIVVASGYNLTILVRLARRLLARWSKFAALAGAAGLVLSFMALTGMSPSMSRAGIVTGLSLFAWYYGRTMHPVVILVVAAALTILIDPSYAWGDAGWLLSFAAFAGVLVVAPLLNHYFFGPQHPGVLRQIIIETTAAQVATLPIIMCLFGQFSGIALLANLLILPLIPLVMLLVFLTGIGAAMHIPFISVVGWLATHLLQYMIIVVEQLAAVSWAAFAVTISVGVAIGLYGCIGAGIVYLRHATKLPLQQTSVIE